MLEKSVGGDALIQGALGAFHILQMQDGPNVVEPDRARKGLAIEQPEAFARTDNRSVHGIQFPASETGNRFGLRQQTFALAQFVFREFLLGNVLRSAENAQGAARVVGDANGARLKNANAAVGKDEANFVFKRMLIAKESFHFLPDARAIVVVEQRAGASERDRLFVR